MKKHKIASVFYGETTIFHYPAEKDTNKAVLVLKGLYGRHIPQISGKDVSWDNDTIDVIKDEYDIFLFNTGRKDVEDEREAFVGKTFQDECADVQSAFSFCKNNLAKESTVWTSVAMSFGGTILLGCPDVLYAMQGVVMIGSGCGKSPTTTKPLLETLPGTPDLLESISQFENSLYFLHGGKDDVVPKESQRKIYESAEKCFSRGWMEFPSLDHKLTDTLSGKSYTASLAKKFLTAIFL